MQSPGKMLLYVGVVFLLTGHAVSTTMTRTSNPLLHSSISHHADRDVKPLQRQDQAPTSSNLKEERLVTPAMWSKWLVPANWHSLMETLSKQSDRLLDMLQFTGLVPIQRLSARIQLHRFRMFKLPEVTLKKQESARARLLHISGADESMIFDKWRASLKDLDEKQLEAMFVKWKASGYPPSSVWKIAAGLV